MEQTEPNAAALSELRAVRVRSRRQAMDWSLVLASQGIEVVIDHQPGVGWSLLVDPAEVTRSVEAIRQYRLENHRWAWRQELAWPRAAFHWGSMIWCLGLIFVFWVTEALPGRLEALGAMRHDVAATGEWWRSITAECLHADVAHLAANVSSGFVLLGLAMGRFGPGKALLGAFLAGAAGNLAGLWLHPAPYTGLGASGVVMGALGLLAAQLFGMLRFGRQALRAVAGGFIGGFLLFVLLGLNPASDVVAHAGGFGAGVVIGAGLALLPERVSKSARIDGFSGAVAILLLALSWALAIGLSTTVAAEPSVSADHRGSQFFGWTSLDGWECSAPTSEGEVVLTSPIIDSDIEWDELVLSWNTVAAPPFGLTAEARGVYPERTTRYYTLGLWSPEPELYPRRSMNGQRNSDGTVRTDTLVLERPCRRAQVRIRIEPGDAAAKALKFVGVSLLNRSAQPMSLASARLGWGRTLDVPRRSQVWFSEGRDAWCSPTSVSMVLAWWASVLDRPELDRPVPEVANGVLDPNWPGTGNWPLNMAYAGSFPGMRAYVVRLTDVTELEPWIASGVPVVASVCYHLLRGRASAERSGHLIVVVGFDATGDIVANDPGTSERIRATFRRDDFVRAWATSRNTAYLIHPIHHPPPMDRHGHWYVELDGSSR